MNQPVHCAALLLAAVLAGLAAQGQAATPALSYCGGGPSGGAAPPQILSAEQRARLASILAPYKADSLTADEARSVQRALGQAGMRRSPALDQALAAAGFAPKRLEALSPCRPHAAHDPAPTASGRAVPRPQ